VKWHATHTLSVTTRHGTRIPALRVMRVGSGELFTKHEWENPTNLGARFKLDTSDRQPDNVLSDMHARPTYDFGPDGWSLNPIRPRGEGRGGATPLKKPVSRTWKRSPPAPSSATETCATILR